MTDLTDHGTLVAPDTIRFERLLPGPIERVWAYLTEPDLLATWLARGEVGSAPGGMYRLDFRAMEQVTDDHPGDHVMLGRVVAIDPPRLLECTWTEEGEGIDESVVRFELEPRGDRVALLLTHRRLPADEVAGVSAGWHTHLLYLAARLAGVQPPPFMPTFQPLRAHYAALTKS